MVNITTLLVSLGLIIAGVILGWKLMGGGQKKKSLPPADKKGAMDELMGAKSTKGQSVVSGESQFMHGGKKGMFDK